MVPSPLDVAASAGPMRVMFGVLSMPSRQVKFWTRELQLSNLMASRHVKAVTLMRCLRASRLSLVTWSLTQPDRIYLPSSNRSLAELENMNTFFNDTRPLDTNSLSHELPLRGPGQDPAEE